MGVKNKDYCIKLHSFALNLHILHSPPLQQIRIGVLLHFQIQKNKTYFTKIEKKSFIPIKIQTNRVCWPNGKIHQSLFSN